MQKSMSLAYEPASEPLHISVNAHGSDGRETQARFSDLFTEPVLLRSFAPVMAGAATSQRTAAVTAKAPGAARLSGPVIDGNSRQFQHAQPATTRGLS